MKKIFLLCFVLLASTIVSFGQWISSGSNIYYNNGNVGIGINSSLTSKFTIGENGNAMSINCGSIGFNRSVQDGIIYNSSKSAWQFTSRDEMFSLEGYNGAQHQLITFLKNGNIGIGMSNPLEKIQIGESNIGVANANKIKIAGVYNFEQVLLGQYGNGACGLEFNNHRTVSESYGVRLYVNVDQREGFQIQIADRSSSHQGLIYQTQFFIGTNGHIGMGTLFPQYKLDVVGTIRAHEIVVNTQNGGADFVFADDYRLRPLSEVEQFIVSNKHLPEIASADSMIQNGVNMGEFQIQLLQKIEELTLYVIDLKKENDAQQKAYEKQNLVVEALKNEIEKIKNNGISMSE